MQGTIQADVTQYGHVGPPPAESEFQTSGRRSIRLAQQLVTTVVAFGPAVVLCVVLARVFHVDLWPWNLLLAATLYFVVGHGITVGFHRLFTHRAFEARRGLKIALGIVGSMAVQGSLIGWVADHRRHHRYADRPGDPHSPLHPGRQRLTRIAGFWHSHVGWFFKHESTSRVEYAPDLLADRDLVLVDRLFLPCAVLSFAGPFGIGYAITGTFAGGLAAFIWAGVLRVGLMHHVSWATNSVCHMFGRRPFRTTDDSRNVRILALLSMGESWHNAHHAFPTLARHGVDRFQLDTSAWLIRLFERLGWATRVRWPDPVRLATRRITA